AARGHSQPRIQKELYLAQGTVNAHVMSIYHKMGVHSQQELIAFVEKTAAAPWTRSEQGGP
ncbi:MAG: LuxR C-terminal-related transcriptional regulator, partial [Coriobacteriales bacterium]|nr:LuxR C-terminal-related transcriptional regulator [Coriobacteriales bacterium]